MAHLLNAEGVRVTHAARSVLAGVSLGLDDGDRVGVVGLNGAGKSTLLQVLARRQQPDDGRVTLAGGVRLAALWQSDEIDPVRTVRRSVLGDAAEHLWATDPRIREVVAGLLGDLAGGGVGGWETPVGRLSGGQRRRVQLAAVLAGDPDVLLLDEPTNHLDVDGIAWLAENLNRRWAAGRGALLLVTHDRWFLDAVCTRIWEVHDGAVADYDGGYAAFVLARAERARIAAATEDRRQNLLRKELAWLRRGPPARSSKPRFRIDAANALIAAEPPARDSVTLSRLATSRLGKDVVDLEDVGFAVGAGDDRRQLLAGVTWRLGPGDRVGVIGANGSGKTTLLRLAAGELVPDAGRVRIGRTVRPALLSQHLQELDEVAELPVQVAVERVWVRPPGGPAAPAATGSWRRPGPVRIGEREITAGQLLERLGFPRPRLRTLVGELSGGERRRVQLLRLLMTEPNLLLLDEPTNDLDTDTLAAVEDTLDDWPGTLVVVSHDRYLLERVADRQVALLGDGRLRDLPRGVDEYLALRPAPQATEREPDPPRPAGGRGAAAAADSRAARKEMARLERQLARLAVEADRLHAELAARATDHEAVQRLDARLRAVDSERLGLEDAWLAAAERSG